MDVVDYCLSLEHELGTWKQKLDGLRRMIEGLDDRQREALLQMKTVLDAYAQRWAAMYTDSYGSSYVRDPGVKQSVKQIVEAALRSDVYVIVDWHILEDGNPNRYRQQAKEFFEGLDRAAIEVLDQQGHAALPTHLEVRVMAHERHP